MKYCPMCSEPLSSRVSEGKTYASCECGFTHWNNPTPVVAAIVLLNDQVVLVHHKEWPEKMLGLVTGFLEEGEDPAEAVQREVKEELNLDAKSQRLIGAYGFSQQNQVIIAYELECEGEVSLNDELDRYKLLEPTQLKPWDFGTGLAIKDWLAEQG